MTPINLGSYKSIYLQTAKEYADKMLASLEELINDASDKEAVSNIHISSHSLKSQSQVMGFVNMAALCAIIEKISAAILAGSYKLNTEFIAILKDSINQLNLCLAQIEKENTEKNLESIIKKLEDAKTLRPGSGRASLA